MSKHTPGPLTVRIQPQWPFNIETLSAAGEVVFIDPMPAYSTSQKSVSAVLSGHGMGHHSKEESRELNERAVADAVLRATAPELLEVLMTFVFPYQEMVPKLTEYERREKALAVIAKAMGGQ